MLKDGTSQPIKDAKVIVRSFLGSKLEGGGGGWYILYPWLKKYSTYKVVCRICNRYLKSGFQTIEIFLHDT